jgi:hypothetical protein
MLSSPAFPSFQGLPGIVVFTFIEGKLNRTLNRLFGASKTLIH